MSTQQWGLIVPSESTTVYFLGAVHKTGMKKSTSENYHLIYLCLSYRNLRSHIRTKVHLNTCVKYYSVVMYISYISDLQM